MSEVKSTKVKKVKPKSPSQKVRGILYLHWEWHQSTPTFEEFYEAEMNRIIKSLKKTYL